MDFNNIFPSPYDERDYKKKEYVAVGYDKKGIVVQNSHGKYWGNNGRAIMPFDYPIEEVWGVESLENAFTTIELEKNKKRSYSKRDKNRLRRSRNDY